MTRRFVRQGGFSLVSALFLLVVLAGLGVFAVRMNTLQQQTVTADLRGVQALQAARTGIEWGAYRALVAGSCAASTALALLSGQEPLLSLDREPSLRASIVTSLEPSLTRLSAHPNAAVRSGALALLAGCKAKATDTQQALSRALDDDDERVSLVALDAIEQGALEPALLTRVSTLARLDPRWSIRLRAVAALGRLRAPAAVAPLGQVLTSDAYAYVREAAALALGQIGSPLGITALAVALGRDPEPRVRRAAFRAVRGIGGPAAQQALSALDPRARAELEAEVPRN